MRVRNFLGWVWCWYCVSAIQHPVCDHAPKRCVELGKGHDEFYYRVDGEDLVIKFTDGGYFAMECGKNMTLDNEALPRFIDEVRVARVHLIDCHSPKQSYAQVLRRLKVVALTALTIREARSAISAFHLAGLTVSTLALVKLQLAPDAFSVFNATQLRLDTVKSIALDNLPASLQSLHLVEMGIRNITLANFQNLPSLAKLTVREKGTINVEASGILAELALEAESVWLNPALPDKLEKVTINGWAETAPTPWKSCSALKELVIDGEEKTTLPKDWLINCKSLTNLTVKRRGLEELPNGLLDNAKSLSLLNLSENRLKELPSGLFGKTRQLRVLDLSKNNLTSEIFTKLVAVTSLFELRLNGNKYLGDACPSSNGVSLLQDLTRLRQLGLSSTGANFVCRDFRENMSLLKQLDLSNNHITELTYSDLRFDADVAVDLSGNNVTTLQYTRDELKRLLDDRGAYCGHAAAAASRASFELDAALRCDCRDAWAALALRQCPGHVRLPRLRCAGGGALAADGERGAERDIDEFVCALPRERCVAPAPCECAERPGTRNERGGRALRVLRVRCAGAGLSAVPVLPRVPDAAWQLLLPNNSIASLRSADLPSDLLALDLRGNPMTVVEPAVVLALPPDARLWLANGSLSCGCDNEAGIAALFERRDIVQNLRGLRCADGTPLRRPACAGIGAALAGALALPLLLAAAGAACLARRDVRARIKRALRGLGVLPPRAEPDDERLFDVFVSFSHRDSEVVEQLLAGLEPRYRVCVHFRDWAPGAWIPAQIAASVRRSRRTLAVVSSHFLASAWARAEFREAHAAALRDAEPRLVVVLLDEPARLPLDAELRRYLATNTYVRWGDAWFWRKLRAALPPPRGALVAPAPSSTPVPAPAPAPALAPVLPLTGAAA